MTPSKYETLIDQLLTEEVDMAELCNLVAAEKNKREEKAREKQKNATLTAARDFLIDALICYIEEVIEDENLAEWLETDDAFEQISGELIKLEKNIKETGRIFSSYGIFKPTMTKKDADEILKEWAKRLK